MTNQQDLQAPTEPIVIPIEEQINQELVKHNVTEALIADLKQMYMPLVLKDLNDKETYVAIKEGRKHCKQVRVTAEKLCKKGREDANAISKAWVAKEKDVAGRIGEVEDHLEKQEKEFEAEQEKQKALRKRQQEEQLIRRQTQLTNMGALYSDGSFALGEVSFELSLVKECEEDIWVEQILPKFTAEYQKIESERIEADRKKKEQEEELKRQQEEMQRKQRELEQREADLKKAEEEKQRKDQADEARRRAEENQRIEKLWRDRLELLRPIGWNGQEAFAKYDESVIVATYDQLITWADDEFKSAYESHHENVLRIEKEIEEKRQAEIEEQKKIAARNALNKSRQQALLQYDHLAPHPEALADMNDDEWDGMLETVKGTYEAAQREKWEKEQEEKKKLEEQREAQRLLEANEKEKWQHIIDQLDAIVIHKFKSGQYGKKAAILREKLEEVKAL